MSRHSRPTVKATLSAIRALGLSARYTDGEYRVNLWGGLEATAYYTTDAMDAMDTACVMARTGGR